MATPTHGPFHGAYLASITVGNLRCFSESETLNLLDTFGRPARWTLLLGENGTGKTTLLHAMAAASLDPKELNPNRSSEGMFLPRGFAVPPARHQNEGAALGEITINATLSVMGGLDGAPVRTVTTSLWLREPGLQLPDEISRESYELGWPAIVSHWFGYGPQRRLGAGKLSGEPSDPFASLFSLDAPLVNAEEWYLQRDYASSNPRLDKAARDRAEKTRDRLEILLKSILPGVEQLIPMMIPASDLGQFRLYAYTPYGPVPVSELGFGYQTTLAWVVDLAARMVAAYPASDDPFAEPAVVLIDEIDLHLHPKWQRTLLRELSLRFPNVQFIATAHSPLIVQAAPDANIAVLRRDGDHVIIDQHPHNVKHWRIDQILTSDLFGLPSARDPALDALLARRDALLAKPSLTADDERELGRLREKIGTLPGGETPWEMEAMEIIRRAARSLEEQPSEWAAEDTTPSPVPLEEAHSAAGKNPATKKHTRRAR